MLDSVQPFMSRRFDPRDRLEQFPILRRLRQRVLVFDGGMGTMLQLANLTLGDFKNLEGCNEILVETRPDVVGSIHDAYFAAGADVVETNSFGGQPYVLAEFDIGHRAFELNRMAAVVAKQSADRFSTKEWPRFVAGSMGPGTRLITLGHISADELHAAYKVFAAGLIAGGADCLNIETCQDLLQVKLAILASRDAMLEQGREIPIFCTVTVETTGTLLVGSDIAAALTTLEHLPVDVVGLNCATGPDLMQESVRHLGKLSTRQVMVMPNAGLPRNVGGKAVYDLSPAELARFQARFVQEFGVSVVGGCCGTTPEHVRVMAQAVRQLVPNERPTDYLPQVASLFHSVPLSQDSGPLLIGERTNANGSKKFRDLMLVGDVEGMLHMAKEQSHEGAHVLDVCVAYVGRNEALDMTKLIQPMVQKVTTPLMIDSTQIDVVEAALKVTPGRAIINSINLEDGEAKADQLCELAVRYGAMFVALTIDEDGMAKTAERKLEVAQRIYDIVVNRHGMKPGDLIFDPLTFTIGSGDEASRNAGAETLKGIELIKQRMPGVRTILGLSNISFGLDPYSRQILNSVYLAEAIRNGLDAAIVHASKIIPIHKLDEQDRAVTLDLIYDRRRTGYDPLFEFIGRFQGAKRIDTNSGKNENDLPIEERLKRRIIDGNKIGIELHLDEALRKYQPLEVVNDILLDGMKVVGELFGSGEMQLPFVLQSAEAMKFAVGYLQQFMAKVVGAEKGTMVLATVRGDVHDIGKNLVDIVVSNNGYKVVNLGIKMPIDRILEAAREHKADAIGMSGLLVKSTVVMKENLELMSQRGITTPVVCGGAALNRVYVETDLRAAYTTGPVYYGKDAFAGLHLMDELTGRAKVHTVTEVSEPAQRSPMRRRLTRADKEKLLEHAFTEYVDSGVLQAPSVPVPPFWGPAVVGPSELPLGTVFQYVNRKALFRMQWQYKQGKRPEEAYKKFVAEFVEPRFKEWQRRVLQEQTLEPRVAYGYWPCYAERNSLIVLDPKDHQRELCRFDFPRQPGGRRLCLTDFFRKQGPELDVVGFQLVTMGSVATRESERLFKENRYDDYLHFHGLSVEGAEALAEYWHKRMRQQLSIAEHDAPEFDDLFKQKYQGSRYSFGYPACPNLEDQDKLLHLLEASRIGVALSEEFQLVPEQSTSAVICHHPAAKYFNVTVTQ
ncbi:5-methyltetrahydrofolate--homocysteine methyltransferase [Planctomycetota bacterium]|nr:5-methyltetrahydrofolate--homocysteine methyltransferase [Planctomycetota bacterium]